MFGPLLLLASAAAANSSDRIPTKPRLLNLEEVFTADDYPSIAQQRGYEGRVFVRVRVDASGLVSSCSVVRSSGLSSLDDQTCALFRARARFEPARDRQGQRIASDYTKSVVWKLERDDRPSLPRQAWMIRQTVALSTEAAVVDCKVEATGLPPPTEVCLALNKAADVASRSAGPVAMVLTSETYFYPVDVNRARMPPALSDTKEVAQQVSRLVIEADGHVSDCSGIRYSGGATPEFDACAFVKSERFVAIPAGSPPLVATVVMTAYRRRQTAT